MNKRGFTLIELLATLVILSALVLIASVSVTSIVKKSKKDLYDSQLVLIESAAKIWGASNLDKLPENNSCSYLILNDLKNQGLLNKSIVNSITKNEIPNDMKIKISSTINKYGLNDINYEADVDVTGCNYINLDETN